MYVQCTSNELDRIDSAPGHSSLVSIAEDQLYRMHNALKFQSEVQKIGMVIGPITNGGVGKGDRCINLRVFGNAVEHFRQIRNGLFFSQMPFEDAIARLSAEDEKKNGKEAAHQNLLDNFYLPLLEGLVGELQVLPDWSSSKGARWERAQGLRLGMDVKYISTDLAFSFDQNFS